MRFQSDQLKFSIVSYIFFCISDETENRFEGERILCILKQRNL